jgi:integrase
MTTRISNGTPTKPEKPRKDFPLFAHANGQWAKKVRNKIRFFGVWDDPKAALDRWLDEKDALLADRVPRSHKRIADSPALHEVCNSFLTTKEALRDAGELSRHTFKSYVDNCKEVTKFLGRDRLVNDIEPEDFLSLRSHWAQRWGVVRLAAEINRSRAIFNFAFKNRMIPAQIVFGESFKRPSKKTMRLSKAAGGSKMFQAEELRRMIATATQPLKSMLLLAINSGMGNNDVGLMPLSAIDLETGWLTYPRPKTGIKRYVPLWPETIASLKEWLTKRPAPKEGSEDLVFLTARGVGWTDNIDDRPITHETRKLLDRLKITGRRNFYNIRHTFETIGGESLDQPAVDSIMGHDDGSMASNYRERMIHERLKRVTEYVRKWLLDEGAEPSSNI